MKRILMLVYATLVLSCCKFNSSSDESKSRLILSDGTLITVRPLDKPIVYHVIRKERSTAWMSEDYKQDFDIEFDVEISFATKGVYQLRIRNFKGIDLNGTESNHLKKITKQIEASPLVRGVNEYGPTGEVEFEHFNPGGWAGMIVARAVGRYELGFLDIVYPSSPIQTGEQWNANNNDCEDLANAKVLEKPLKTDQTVEEANGTLAFRLKSLERNSNGELALIECNVKGFLTYVDSDPFGNEQEIKSNFQEVGSFRIDASTGWPIRSTIRRTETRVSGEYRSVQEISTDVTRK